MHVAVSARCSGQAIMHGMGSREPGRLKAKAGKQSVCFHQALEVLAANGVRVMVDARGGYTPTPAVSRAILAHNASGQGPRADGIVVTPAARSEEHTSELQS